MASKREQLESLLDKRGWGTTLPAQRPVVRGAGDHRLLEQLEADGPPAGILTELVPSQGSKGSSGVTTTALRLAAASQPRGPMAWLDPLDQWDPDSAQRTGLALDHILWLRGTPVLGLAGLSRWNEILGLVIQSGGMALVVADFLAWPAEELRRIPRSAWFRLLRSLERTRHTALLLLSPQPITQGCAALVLESGDGKRPVGKVVRDRVRLPASA